VDVVTDNVKSASDTAAAKGAERERPSVEASEAKRLAHILGGFKVDDSAVILQLILVLIIF
jgi:hypothetical protein